MSQDLISDIIKEGGGQIAVTIKVADLASFANTIANNVAQCVVNGAVEAISEAMGESLKYCDRKEAIKILRTSSSTLARWESKGCIKSMKVGGKNVYLRQELLALRQKKL